MVALLLSQERQTKKTKVIVCKTVLRELHWTDSACNVLHSFKLISVGSASLQLANMFHMSVQVLQAKYL